jgi:methionyl-tRNA synthetase
MVGGEGPLFGESVVETFEETERSHRALVYDAASATGEWLRPEIPPGRQLMRPEPLFRKLDDEVAAEELERLVRPPE